MAQVRNILSLLDCITQMRRLLARTGIAVAALGGIALAPEVAHSFAITVISDAGGGIVVDGAGNVYVAGPSDNAFKIDPNGVITEIIDSSGDGAGNRFDASGPIAVDASGNIYVVGFDNVFKIESNGVITEIMQSFLLALSCDVAVDGVGNVYVCGLGGVFKINTPTSCSTDPDGTPCVISEITDPNGDGGGRSFVAIAADAPGNVYVTESIKNAFKIDPNGVITEIIDSSGDGAGNPLTNPGDIAVDASGNVYVTGAGGNPVAFEITPGGVITKIFDGSGGLPLVATDGLGNVYIADSIGVFQIDPNGVITQIMDTTGDGQGNPFFFPGGIAADDSSNVYVTGSGKAFRIGLLCDNGVLDSGEECDDGNDIDGDGCDSNCTFTGCGNGIRTVGEVCDDGNNDDGDGCSADCLTGDVSPLPKADQKCINSINKGAAKVAKAQAGDNAACIKDFAKDKKLSAEACITSDPKGKVQKAISKIKTDDCPSPPANLLGIDTDSASIGATMVQKDLDLIHAIFGSNLDVTVVKAADDKAGSKCQAAIAKAAGKCQDAKLASYNTCKKDGQKAGSLFIPAAFEAECLTPDIPDGKGKIQKKCGGDFGLAKKCTGTTTPLDELIPGCAPGVTAACIDQKVECVVCLALNALDGLFRDCDEFDDGVVNGSCP